MSREQNLFDQLKPYQERIDTALRAEFDALPDYRLYGMLRYFMGFADEELRPTAGYGGKRFRSMLTLVLADAYNVSENALPLATALELFHNFTLIHDDIEDNDEERRGRPTVWKLWGVPHAINAGDAQLLLVSEVLTRGCAPLGPSGYSLMEHMLGVCREVAEGQYLDFTLAEMSLGDASVDESIYFDMLTKKTSVLVALAAEIPGILAECTKDEQEALWAYGLHLGIAYQLYDDWMSIWGTRDVTGKQALGDLKEKKKTLPVLRAREALTGGDRARLIELYGCAGALQDAQVQEVKVLLESAGVQAAVHTSIADYRTKARSAVDTLSVSDENKRMLRAIVDTLVPEPPTV